MAYSRVGHLVVLESKEVLKTTFQKDIKANPK